MKPNFVMIGATCAALGIALGAFGAHALRGQIAPAELGLWETATRYWLVGSLGMLLFGVYRRTRELGATPTSQPAPSAAAGWLLLGGSILFAGSLYGLALGAPRFLGVVTPFGGAGLIAGFTCFALSART